MTHPQPAAADPRVVAEAQHAAQQAANEAGVRLEHVRDMDRLAIFGRIVDEVWRPPPGQTTVPAEFLRALTHAGNYCGIAWAGERPIGACLGFLSVDPPLELHSHIAGVVPDWAGRHVGRALKLDQRAWALERGFHSVGWTFDPLVRRNAFFNVVRLGAVPKDYLVDFYGPMTDAINTGDATDRLKVTWWLTAERVRRACTEQVEARASSALIAEGATVALDADSDGTVGNHAGTRSETVLVGVPRDIEAVRRSDPALGQRWRMAVRDILGGLMNDGWAVTEFCSDGYYVLSRHEERQPQ